MPGATRTLSLLPRVSFQSRVSRESLGVTSWPVWVTEGAPPSPPLGCRWATHAVVTLVCSFRFISGLWGFPFDENLDRRLKGISYLFGILNCFIVETFPGY